MNWLSIILSDCYSQLGHTSDSFFKHLYVLKTLYNPNFSFHILSTPLSMFPLLLTKRMYLTIKAFRLMITSYDRNDWMIMISSIVREIWCWSLLGFKGLNLRYHILGIDGGGLFEDKHNWVENANCITYNSAGCSLQVTSRLPATTTVRIDQSGWAWLVSGRKLFIWRFIPAAGTKVWKKL